MNRPERRRALSRALFTATACAKPTSSGGRRGPDGCLRHKPEPAILRSVVCPPHRGDFPAGARPAGTEGKIGESRRRKATRLPRSVNQNATPVGL